MDARSKTKLAVLVAVLVCAAASWISIARDSSTSAPVVAAEARVDATHDLADVSAIEPVAERAGRVVVAEPLPAPVEAAVVFQHRVRGRVLDLDRRPVAGLEIRRFDGGRTSGARSGADGTFEIALEHAGSALEAHGPGWATVCADRHDEAGAGDVVTVVVARAGRVAGRVVDRADGAIADAEVSTKPDDDVLRALSDVLAADPDRLEYSAASAPDGRFDLGEVPLAFGSLFARRDDRKSALVPMPDIARDDVELVLEGPAGVDVVVRGRVLEASGAPANDAIVALARLVTRSKSDGAFELRVFAPESDDERRFDLVAVRSGASPARVAIGTSADLARAGDREYELVLGGAPLWIRGRVVDEKGEPVAGVHVRVDDEEHLGVFASGQDAGHLGTFGVSVERVLRGEHATHSMFDRIFSSKDSSSGTPPDGSFAIHGLQDRNYDVYAELDRLTTTTVPSVAAGTHDLVVVLATEPRTQRVSGRVVDGEGRAIADADVQLTVASRDRTRLSTLPSMRSNADGAFAFERVPGVVAEIAAKTSDRRITMRRTPDDATEDVVIALRPLRAIQIDTTSDPAFATSFEVHDAEFGSTPLHEWSSTATRSGGNGGGTSGWRRSIRSGRSSVVRVMEGRLTAILYREKIEVARVPIVLAGAGVTIVRF